MEFLNNYLRKTRTQLILLISVAVLTPITIVVILSVVLDDEPAGLLIFGALALGITAVSLASWKAVKVASDPLYLLWQLVEIKTSGSGAVPPSLDNLKAGKELVSTLADQYYRLVDARQKTATTQTSTTSKLTVILNNAPLPIAAIDSQDKIVYTNTAYLSYTGKKPEEVLGTNIHESLDLSFQNNNTLKNWLDTSRQSKVTDQAVWSRVRLNVGVDQPPKQLDLAAYFNKGATDGVESIIAIFDNTEKYGNDDQEVSFVALAVHELRTPLTILRGYIEVFEDELSDKLSPELKDFMFKMQASAQQLTAFVSNILNVARVEENQLTLKLMESGWADVLKAAIADLELRAKVRNKHIELQIAEGLPTVGVDRISIQEVINNLVDNAIKYGGDSPQIIVRSQLNKEGMVETSVQDFGVGIPTAVMPNLFNKYYRSHKSNTQIGGTGLGLYISKALVTAHGGNLTVNSKEGEGSTFSFTVMPYATIRKEDSENGEDGIIRGAHGWIKNHSLYRR